MRYDLLTLSRFWPLTLQAVCTEKGGINKRGCRPLLLFREGPQAARKIKGLNCISMRQVMVKGGNSPEAVVGWPYATHN